MATRGDDDDMDFYNMALVARVFAVVGGLLFVGSLAFFAVSYAWRFADVIGPWSWANGGSAVLLDAGMFSLFALHHSVFARSGGREWVRRRVSPELERSVYVWLASLLFLWVCLWWVPVPGAAWELTGAFAFAFWLVQAVGAVFTIIAAKHFDLLELAGVRQALQHRADQPVRLDGPYGVVRHPIYLGWFAMVWFPPAMNGTRLVFAAVSCAYLLMAIPFEERDLQRTFGAAYETYMRRVRWKLIPGVY
jgi:methanethiol S-methyltransferase